MKIHSMWKNYPELETDLKKTGTLMVQSVTTQNDEVANAIIEMLQSGGKMLRPAFCLLFARFGPQQDSHKARSLAAALEMLHTATLIHDDIVDDSALRRNQPTLQARFGKDVAVYAGDYLFILCFKLLAEYASDLKSVQTNYASIEKILTGELKQMSTRYDYEITIEQYLGQINGKTAQLFGISTFVGAYESGCSDRFSKRARDIGINVGLAFQIMDDILDYSQEQTIFGKPVLEDIRQGVYSAPLILAMADHQVEFKPLLAKQSAMTDSDVEAILTLIQKYNGVQKATLLAQKYTDLALKEMQKLPKGTAKDELIAITEELLSRRQ